jgi:hypothetical protein
MRLLSICLLIAGILFCAEGNAQVSFKTEYIGKSGYWYMPNGDKPSERIGNSEGSSIVWQGNANIPFYLKKNENGRPTAWGAGIGGAYASLNNRNFTGDMVSEIMNLQFGLFHIRPLNDKWSMMASIGAGVYAPFTELSKIRFGKTGVSIPLMAGINAYRPAYYSDRTLKGMFATNNDFYFSVSPYASVGIRYGF